MLVSEWYCILCKTISGIVFCENQTVVLYFMSVSGIVFLCQSISGIVFYVSQSVVLYFSLVSQWYYILCQADSGIVIYVSQ